jgi:hypothetical protein
MHRIRDDGVSGRFIAIELEAKGYRNNADLMKLSHAAVAGVLTRDRSIGAA